MPVVKEQRSNDGNKKAIGGVLSRIQPVGNFDTHWKIALYGQSGSGKTTLVSTFPKPMLIAVCSGAGETRSISKKDAVGIDAVKIEDEQELKTLAEHAVEVGKYKTFVLDHASGFQELVLKAVLKLDQAPRQLAWGTASQSQWGDVGLGMKDHLGRLLDLPCNVVIVAQERVFNDENTGEVLAPHVGCALSPSVTGWLNPSVDYLLQMFKRSKMVERKIKAGGVETVHMVPDESGEVEYCLRTGPHPVYNTKVRLPRGNKVPQLIVDPDFSKLAKLLVQL